MFRLTCAVLGSATALKAVATIRTLHFMTILRCGLSLLACCIFKARHDGFLWMILAPRFHVRDVLLVGHKINRLFAELVAEPTAHPCGEAARLWRRHCKI